jgi:uncharacterized protein
MADPAVTEVSVPVVDGCAFHEWPSLHALAPYLPDGWRELLLRPHDKSGPAGYTSQFLYESPRGGKLPSAYGKPGARAASDRDLVIDQLLGSGSRSRVVLGYEDGLLAAGAMNHYMSEVVVSAANDWTAKEWLTADDRFYGLILISTAMPDRAVAEVRRCGSDSRFVGVALGPNVLSRPFGHPIYHPIYEACQDLELPIVLQVGSDNLVDQVTPPISGGLPITFGEYRALSFQSQMAHLASMLIQGIFERYPRLKVLILGGGAAWAPAWLWRLDYFYKIASHEVPWLTRLPSEYAVTNVRFSTTSLEDPADSTNLMVALGSMPEFENMLVYASSWPNEDTESPAEIAARLPKEWHRSVFLDNAHDLYRWPIKDGLHFAGASPSQPVSSSKGP